MEKLREMQRAQLTERIEKHEQERVQRSSTAMAANRKCQQRIEMLEAQLDKAQAILREQAETQAILGAEVAAAEAKVAATYAERIAQMETNRDVERNTAATDAAASLAATEAKFTAELEEYEAKFDAEAEQFMVKEKAKRNADKAEIKKLQDKLQDKDDELMQQQANCAELDRQLMARRKANPPLATLSVNKH